MLAKFMFIGRLTKDCELVDLPNGKQKANISIAINNGNDSNYFNLIAFENKATLCTNYLKKGNQAYFEGQIKPRSYEKDGVKHYVTDYIIQTVEFLSRNSQNNANEEEQIPF